MAARLTRYDRRTGQVENVAPKPIRPADFRALRTAPVVFSPVDPHILYFAANTLWKTRDGGHNWQQISPDLTRKTWEIPANVGKYRDEPTAQAVAARRNLCGGALAAGCQSHLGGHRRRPDSRDRRWRPALERRHAAAAGAVREGFHSRRRALRRADRLRGHQHAAPGRHAAAHPAHARRRQDLD